MAEILCRLEEIPDGQARGFVLDRGERTLRLLVARRGGDAFGYQNVCPHAGIPLDWNHDDFMSLDGRHLQCATHGAQFRVEDGFCIVGPCQGRSLRPAPVRIEADGTVVLAE
ncbi:Rieske (2Fe-2S) protein [Oleisolibacter albus]|uniref:Rieske (2Fe-2S) protein n=1 Tax=Oleisolibacter albus TaxID=2171757 RepID=UPI000DF12785|nr:Rieske (2Fe-2S) protein [Oleisolibacter albus]